MAGVAVARDMAVAGVDMARDRVVARFAMVRDMTGAGGGWAGMWLWGDG